MKAMPPAHRKMVANTISQLNGETRRMNMAADAARTATADSLRQDLVRMPEMSAGELAAMKAAHMGRETRLGDMHQQIMRSMRK